MINWNYHRHNEDGTSIWYWKHYVIRCLPGRKYEAMVVVGPNMMERLGTYKTLAEAQDACNDSRA